MDKNVNPIHYGHITLKLYRQKLFKMQFTDETHTYY
jgi:hypothetical protein